MVEVIPEEEEIVREIEIAKEVDREMEIAKQIEADITQEMEKDMESAFSTENL